MISKQELQSFSRELGIRLDVVEKDYVLGWLLAGINQHPVLGPKWVFKGGTCLKKCYFETYRFSEDLDFTVKEKAHFDVSFLKAALTEVTQWVYDQSGIEFPPEAISYEILSPRGGIAAQGKVGYRGPMGLRGSPPRIKLDLTGDEKLVMAPTKRSIHHPYSDAVAGEMEALSYPFEEVFAEKTRALAERARPRDLYDVVHLYRHKEAATYKGKILEVLKEKCTFKGIAIPTWDSMQNHPKRDELNNEWGNMLAHQLPMLPPLQQFWDELSLFFKWLYGVSEAPQLPVMSTREAIDTDWTVPDRPILWNLSAPIEKIRFAAANRLCVELTYEDETGSVNRRLVEPYSLRRTKEGHIQLFLVKHDTQETRGYRLDRIREVNVSRISFQPKFVVEISEGGGLGSVPRLGRGR